jgi:hypothetical protein
VIHERRHKEPKRRVHHFSTKRRLSGSEAGEINGVAELISENGSKRDNVGMIGRRVFRVFNQRIPAAVARTPERRENVLDRVAGAV